MSFRGDQMSVALFGVFVMPLILVVMSGCKLEGTSGAQTD